MRRIERALILTDDVGTSLPDRSGQVLSVPIQHFYRYIAQRTNSRIPFREISSPFFAFFTASVVGAGRVIVLDHCVAHHDPDTRGNRDGLKLQRTAIEKNGVPRLPHARDELVHDSHARADKTVLSLLTEFGDLG